MLIFTASAILVLSTIAALALLKVITLYDSVLGFIFTIIGLLLPLGTSLIEKLKDSTPWETYLRFLIKKEKLSPKTVIRISYAAHLIVEVNGKYLLLKNHHGINLYHFPSWTYSLSEEESLNIQLKFGAIKDGFIKKDYNDYRFLIPTKKLKSFYKYFCENVDPYNYSCQNLVDDFVARCGLNKDIFSNANTIFKQRKIKRIEFARYTDHYEMNVADVYLLCPNKEQLHALQQLENCSNPAFKFATFQEIKRNGINEETGNLYADIAPFSYDLLTSESTL